VSTPPIERRRRSPPLDSLLEHVGRRVVSREEGLEVQFGEGDVGGGREGSQRRDETKVAVTRLELQRHRESKDIWFVGQRWEVTLELGQQHVERRIRAAHQTRAQVLGDVASPLRQIADARCNPSGVQRQPERNGTSKSMVRIAMNGARTRVQSPEPEHLHGTRGRTWTMVIGTVLALAAVLSQVPSLAQLWEVVRDATWWWIALAVAFTFGNRVGYALALMGSVSIRLPFIRSVEALIAAAFSNLAVPGIGGTTVQVRYLQLQGVDLASAVAAGAVLANVANVVVQGTLFLVAVALTSHTFDLDRIDLENVAAILMVIVFLAGVLVAIVFGVRRLRERARPAMRRATVTIRTALHSPRQVLLLVVGNLCAALMSALCLFACVEAYGGSVGYWPLLIVNIIVGTIASLIPIPGGNTLVAAVGLTVALVAAGVPETVAVAAVITQQLIATYLPALPGWFATNDMLRRGLL
jgi:uncharacterized membrane protein YbhN (UPF0104 family)